MNSNFGKSSNQQKGSVPLNNFDFDFGLGSGLSNNRPRSLKDQKQQTSPYSFSSSSSSSYTSTPSKPASSPWTSNKPSWTHQPAPSQAPRSELSNSASMVGDIFGKTWNSRATSGPSAGLGIAEKNPNLFGDLVGSALGQGKSSSNVPLKNAPPASAPLSSKNSYNMDSFVDSLPKTNNPMNRNQGSAENFGSYVNANINNTNINRTGNLGGPSMRSAAGVPASSNKDPFGSLLNFGSKEVPKVKATSNNSATTGDLFGDFQKASKSATPSFQPDASPVDKKYGTSGSKMEDFGIPTQESTYQKQPPLQSTGIDPLDTLFSSSSASTAAPMSSGNQPLSEVDDWGLDSGFGGNDVGDSGSGTTELEGLPPPPIGVNASIAKNKGLDSHKQGQYADAIKWLSWAVVLLEKSGDNDGAIEVLSCRASCYKEVGEYKKAVVDCSKVLDHDDTNVSVLIQRALLYESTEKYKLGAEDLRTVLKIDPSNRLARSTIHRLTKLAEY